MHPYIRKVRYALYRRFLLSLDLVNDLHICGRSLVRYVPSIYRDDANGIGGTGTQSTHYLLMKRIFSHVTLTADDAFMDVGCGKGRVLAFLIGQKCPCRLYGVEHNEEVARIAIEWSKRYEQVQIIVGDALTLDYNPYTVLSLARSFLPKTFLCFTEHLEQTLTHPITLIYWWDNESGHLLRGRPGWEMQFRETPEQARKPGTIYYSIWTFDPGKRNSDAAPCP